jgi:hypothetical protein
MAYYKVNCHAIAGKLVPTVVPTLFCACSKLFEMSERKKGPIFKENVKKKDDNRTATHHE